jgi:hypothetical protein
MTLARAVGTIALGTALTAAAPTRVTAAEGEGWAAVGAVFATARADGRWVPGGGVTLTGQYGLTDAWSVHADFAGSWHPVDADALRPGGRVRALACSAGITYALDVLRVVPYVSAGLAVQNLGGALRDARTDLGVGLGGGADYLLDRRWSLGLELGYRILPVALAGDRDGFGGTPQAFTAGLRLARGW